MDPTSDVLAVGHARHRSIAGDRDYCGPVLLGGVRERSPGDPPNAPGTEIAQRRWGIQIAPIRLSNVPGARGCRDLSASSAFFAHKRGIMVRA